MCPFCSARRRQHQRSLSRAFISRQRRQALRTTAALGHAFISHADGSGACPRLHLVCCLLDFSPYGGSSRACVDGGAPGAWFGFSPADTSTLRRLAFSFPPSRFLPRTTGLICSAPLDVLGLSFPSGGCCCRDLLLACTAVWVEEHKEIGAPWVLVCHSSISTKWPQQ